MKMTADLWSQIINLSPDMVPNWQSMNFYAIQRLDRSIPYIGRITITSTTGGTHASNSTHYKGLAFDFSPRDYPLYYVYMALRALGWQRVGIDPGQRIIHADIGELDQTYNYSYPYYFLESNGVDVGQLDNQPASTLAQIPGYDPDLQVASIEVPIIAGDGVENVDQTAAGIDPKTTTNVFLAAAFAIPLFLRIV